jgi:two-component system, chemotaxis family, sensor histidine kinase and response regulator WspE
MSLPDDLSGFSLLELFGIEVETQAAAMTEALLELERDPRDARHLEELMRGAHSLKGAARILNRESAVRVAHAMEDSFVAAQRDAAGLPLERIDALLRGVDFLRQIAKIPEAEMKAWDSNHRAEITAFVQSLSTKSAAPVLKAPETGRAARARETPADLAAAHPPPAAVPPPVAAPVAPPPPPAQKRDSEQVRTPDGRALRVTAENLNRLLGLAGESVVASRWLDGFAAELLRFKRLHNELNKSVNSVRESLAGMDLNDRVRGQLSELQSKTASCRQTLADRLEEMELFDRRFLNLSKRLYEEVLDCRMRPFADGVKGFPRMVRDAAHALGKELQFEIIGQATPVDRDILERIEAPLNHLLRNAVDHGMEAPEERVRVGKLPEGKVRLEARHSAGMLLVEVADDGRGLDAEVVRRAIIVKGLAPLEVAEKLTAAELLEFLFLPGFTMKEAVTEISGRGVGLDVVQTTMKSLGGSVRVTSEPGKGMQFQLQLPITLSVLRALVVEIAGEPYAFPLARVTRAVKLPRESVESIEGREHFRLGDQQIGLLIAHQVLELEESAAANGELSVVVLGDKTARYGLVIDRFLGEQELVVRALDPRLGKLKDISAAALMPDQTPALIVDVDDLLRSIENLISGGRLAHVRRGPAAATAKARKRVLVVDDSLTVRELERKLIDSHGYQVEVAVDGMDGWNAVRTGNYDLVVTDVDMPRLDGIELVSLIKKDPRLHALPVMIVSYKDREEDRQRGLEAGADYYLAKGSFHDETLLRAVADLIGEAFE